MRQTERKGVELCLHHHQQSQMGVLVVNTLARTRLVSHLDTSGRKARAEQRGITTHSTDRHAVYFRTTVKYMVTFRPHTQNGNTTRPIGVARHSLVILLRPPKMLNHKNPSQGLSSGFSGKHLCFKPCFVCGSVGWFSLCSCLPSACRLVVNLGPYDI